MKKLLLLGGSRYLIPAIEEAHKLGIYVITADYLPDNYAHKYADEYHNVSIIDKDAVLCLAMKLNIDGIMSYATDPGVVVAAYVAEELGLPTSPYKSVEILQNKGKFRSFLSENGFNVPYSRCYKECDAAIKDADSFKWPVIVKPVDSAGSKGVTKVYEKNHLTMSAKHALAFSHCGEYIVEEFIEKQGCSSDTDSFSIDGKLVFCSFNSQFFDANANNPYTPAAFIYPTSLHEVVQEELRNELQRLMKLLNMGTTIYNIETRQGVDGKAYIMECSPRAGGNRLAEMLRMSCGQNLIKASVQAAVGLPIDEIFAEPQYDGFWGEIILHSNKCGRFKSIVLDQEINQYVKELCVWVEPGDEVREFTGANETIGTLILRCERYEQIKRYIDNIYSHLTIEVE